MFEVTEKANELIKDYLKDKEEDHFIFQFMGVFLS